MSRQRTGPVAYVMKRYPRLTETFILNEIRAMERLGAELHIFSLLPPEPPPHHPAMGEVTAPVHSPPAEGWAKWTAFGRAHAAAIRAAPLRYAEAAVQAMLWSILWLSPFAVWKQFARAGFVAAGCGRAGVRHIHAHFANAPTTVAWFASVMTGVPFSFTAHAKDLYLTPKRRIRRKASAAEFVATCTSYNARYLGELVGPEAARKVELVYHGIDLPHLAPRRRAVAGAPATGRKVILSVGRLVPKKGHDDLIAACARLHEAGHGFRCMIVGAGPLHAELAAMIAGRGLAGIVSLEGPMTHAKLIDLYRQADLFALAPRIAEDGDRDGIPNVIAEAMAIGVPVVSTDVSGIPEVVRHEETGLLVPPHDPEALARALARLLAEPEAAAALARAARALLERDFDLWTTTRKLHRLIGCAACGTARGAAAPLGARRLAASEAVE
jgi:glycosyltransferase involved in cell wall biosynthesis